jgi:hypothetical protein
MKEIDPKRRVRVLCVLNDFPQLSQTYTKNEIEALSEHCEVRVVCLLNADTPFETRLSWERADSFSRIAEIANEFRPHVLHTHWLFMLGVVHRLAEHLNLPYTVRTHSFDVLAPLHGRRTLVGLWRRATGRMFSFSSFGLDLVTSMINSDHCVGVLAFPFARERFMAAGVHEDKIHDSFPVVAYRRFLDRGPNGEDILNLGACVPKKRMEDFIDLAVSAPTHRFRLYAIGFQHKHIAQYNLQHGSPVELTKPVHPDEMPAVYKRHRWLVYTADRGINTVGWPVAVAEAQAAGVGVCMPKVREDILDYLGGAGFTYDSIAEAREIISKPPPNEIRELGFEVAKRCDIESNINDLIRLWFDGCGEAELRKPDA